MSKMYLFEVIESHYCKLTFIVAFILSYFLIPHNLQPEFFYLSIIFMSVFALVVMCVVRNIKEQILVARTKKSSLITLLISLIGISAFQVCGAGFVCGAGIGMAILAMILPSTMLSLLNEYAFLIIVFSILFQLAALYFMKCFHKNENKLILQKPIFKQ